MKATHLFQELFNTLTSLKEFMKNRSQDFDRMALYEDFENIPNFKDQFTNIGSNMSLLEHLVTTVKRNIFGDITHIMHNSGMDIRSRRSHEPFRVVHSRYLHLVERHLCQAKHVLTVLYDRIVNK